MKDYPTVAKSGFLDIIAMVGSVAFLGAGLAAFGLCGGGVSLLLFGAAVALLGWVLFRTGAWATAIPMGIVTFTLVAAGWYGATVAGCSW